MTTINAAALKRVSKVIQVEATTTSIGDFLLTHVPFENLFLSNGSSISEDYLLRNVLLKNPEEHKFIMIQGGNGSGKSHLIRWLKERYQNQVNPDHEAVLLISRAHNTLQDALAQLLEADIFPTEMRENELKNIKNAKSNITGEELNKTINFNFTLEIDADKGKDVTLLDARTRTWLVEYFENRYIQSAFLLCPSGPIERIRAKIETTDENTVNMSEDPIFIADDFNVSLQQIQQFLQVKDGRATDYTIRLAEKFSNPRHGADLRQKVADYLNTKVSNVIQRSMKLKSADFKLLFANLRKTLKQQNMNLTLFIEDINSFTGIDEALMEVLITDHTAEGNHDYCRIISVVGSTNLFYDNKLNASIKQRIERIENNNIFIKEQSVLGTPSQLALFAAKYINAIYTTEEQIALWMASGARDDNMPVYKTDYKWAEVPYSGDTLTIFPFNQTALWKLYTTLSSVKGNKTPRVFLKSILAHVIKLWLVNPELLFRNENNFINDDISMPRWDGVMYNQSNLAIDEPSAVQRGILLRVWGDGTTRLESGKRGGLVQDVFTAFGIPSGIEKTPLKHTATSNQTRTDVHEFANGVAASVITAKVSLEAQRNTLPIDLQAEIPAIVQLQKPEKLRNIEDDLAQWNSANGSDTKLRTHKKLRELLCSFIVSSIDWEAEGIPMSLVDAYINTLKRVHIEGQPIEIGDGYCLPRNDESLYLLTALSYFRYMGKGERTWDFKGCADYLVYATAWLERHRDEIIQTVIAPKDREKEWNLPLWNVASVYCLKTLFGGVTITKSSDELLIDLFGKSPAYEVDAEHSQAWVSLQEIAKKSPTYKNLMYKEALAYFSKSVGTAEAGATNYIFVDALAMIQQIRKLKSMHWDMRKLCLTDVDTHNDIWYYALNFINVFSDKIYAAIEDEQHKAETYTAFFHDLLGGDYSEQSITDTLKAVKSFLLFLTSDLNISYADNDYRAIKPSETPTRLCNAIANLHKLSEPASPAEQMMRIARNPFENIIKYYDSLSAFKQLLDDKERLFAGSVDQESKRKIDAYKVEIDAEITQMQTIVSEIGGGHNDGN